MDKPIKRTIFELKQNSFVDYLFATYEPRKNSAGDYFPSVLDYTTNEMSYLSSSTEKELIEEHGFAPIGFLEALRVHMSKTSGFGICITNKDLKKALANMAIDFDVEQAELQKYYDLLLECQLIVIVTDSKGKQYATTPQQVFNWEYKMWSRWTNNQYQKKRRGTSGKKAEQDEAEAMESESTEEIEDIPEKPSFPVKEVPADAIPIPELEDDFAAFESSFDEEEFF